MHDGTFTVVIIFRANVASVARREKIWSDDEARNVELC